MRKALLAIAALPLLTAAQCAHDPVTPPAYRFAPLPFPTQPVPEAQCDDDRDGTPEPCLSEAQAADLFNAVMDIACAANDKLAWLSDFYLRTDLPPSCGD